MTRDTFFVWFLFFLPCKKLQRKVHLFPFYYINCRLACHLKIAVFSSIIFEEPNNEIYIYIYIRVYIYINNKMWFVFPSWPRFLFFFLRYNVRVIATIFLNSTGREPYSFFLSPLSVCFTDCIKYHYRRFSISRSIASVCSLCVCVFRFLSSVWFPCVSTKRFICKL